MASRRFLIPLFSSGLYQFSNWIAQLKLTVGMIVNRSGLIGGRQLYQIDSMSVVWQDSAHRSFLVLKAQVVHDSNAITFSSHFKRIKSLLIHDVSLNSGADERGSYSDPCSF